MLVTEPADDLIDRVRSSVEGGVNVVQLRGLRPGWSTRETAVSIRTITRARALLVVNRDSALAIECEADGIHLPVRAPGVGLMRRRIRNGLVGRSVHSVDQALFAESDGADYL